MLSLLIWFLHDPRFNVNNVMSPATSNAAINNIPEVKVNDPKIIGPTKPPNAGNELTSAIPTGAVDSVKKNVK